MAIEKLNAEDVRGLSDDELLSKSLELKETLWKNRMQNFTNQLDDTNSLRRLRRQIARVKTELRGREIKEAQKS